MFYFPNTLGSHIVLTDDHKNVLVRYEYDVFSAIRSETGTSDNVRESFPACRGRGSGKEYERDVRLYYYGARYYDPYIGRFTQRDPAGDGVNWYTYTYNNPLRFIDPDGLRALNTHETEVAQDFFGDMINLDQVEIKDEGWIGRKLGEKNMAVTVHNNIYSKNMSAELFIHELAHVWQYANGRIEPATAGITHVIAAATRQHDELYDYKVDDLSDPNRKTFREYSFEEQASIIQDAYRVLVLGKNPFYNKNYNRGNISGDLKAFYEQFMSEFRQWHRQLRQGRSSSHLNQN